MDCMISIAKSAGCGARGARGGVSGCGLSTAEVAAGFGEVSVEAAAGFRRTVASKHTRKKKKTNQTP